MTTITCQNLSDGFTRSDQFDCCDCGGVNCGCPYCWSCNACDTWLSNSWYD